MEKYGIPPGYSLAYHHPLGFVYKVYFNIIVVVNDVTCRSDETGRGYQEKETPVENI
jgi:hypothetical protein